MEKLHFEKILLQGDTNCFKKKILHIKYMSYIMCTAQHKHWTQWETVTPAVTSKTQFTSLIWFV